MGRNLVIVESPAKARTLERFLGKEYTVLASIGHVRDLPSSASEIPAAVKKEAWARLGVDVDRGYAPLYVVPAGKKAQIRELKAALRGAQALFLATDEDREGESISWHLLQELRPTVPVKRMVFHEITRTAIRDAVENCRGVDERLVDAQEARRILDRLYGYEVSPVLWRKIAPRLSAGRVQSVATRLLVERERERMGFRPASWWDARVTLEHGGQRFPAVVVAVDGRTLVRSRDFTPAGELVPGRDLLRLDDAQAARLAEGITGRTAVVRRVEERRFTTAPKPPFTTSTLQQEAGRKLGMTARSAMQAAQRLYENGYITYMRTDSVKLSAQAVAAARAAVEREFGGAYLPAAPRAYESRARNAQEAHEAIRPAGEAFRSPAEVEREVGGGDARLYELIWRRTLASQMKDALHKALTAAFDCSPAAGGSVELVARGRVVLFEGFLKAYVEGADAPEPNGGGAPAAPAEGDVVLPPLAEGDGALVAEARPLEHRTKPPARYTEAGLVQKLEELGIGRPSTYASIIGTILDREYAFRRKSALVPTWLAFAVDQLMKALERTLVDYSFTAEMEDRLDAIALGKLDRQTFLDEFYRGSRPGLHRIVTEHARQIDPRAICTVEIGRVGEQPIELRVGRFGPYLERGKDRASVPEGLAPDELTAERALELLSASGLGEEPLGHAPDGTPVFLRTGRFGPYVQLGAEPEEEAGRGKKGRARKAKPKRASLFKSMDPRRLGLEQALRLLELPRTLGEAADGGTVVARPGRFGPYLEKSLPGAEKPETRSLPSEELLLTITLEEAEALFAIPKRGRGRAAAPAALRDLGADPAVGARILLRDGRYGPYVTDGKTNATLPKGMAVEAVTLDAALALIAARRAAAPAKKKGARRRSSTTKR